jgi:hypothetical protein
MTRPPTRAALTEIRRLRAERDRLAVKLAQLLDVADDTALRAAEHRETYAAGWAAGYAAGAESEAQAQHASWRKLSARLAGPTFAELEYRRWELRGEPRTRATFAAPHAGDYTPGATR